MFPDSVHPDVLPQPHLSPSSDLSDSPRSASSAQNFFPKPPPPPSESYAVQVQKDRVFRLPPPDSARRMAAYARRAASRRSRRSCLHCLCCAAAPILLLLATGTVGVLYLVVRPAQPAYSLDDLSATGFNLSSSSPAVLSPALLATVRAANPNEKIGIYYLPGGGVTASYGDVRICRGKWPGFFQGRRNVTEFKMPLTGSGVRLSSSVRQKLVTAASRRQISLSIEGNVPVRVTVGGATSWIISFNIHCEVTLDQLTADSKIVSQSCRIKL